MLIIMINWIMQRTICHGRIKGTVSPYKRIFSNGSRMGIPNYTWASGVLTSRSCHLPVPSRPLDLCARDRACAMVLASENDLEKVQKGCLTSLCDI